MEEGKYKVVSVNFRGKKKAMVCEKSNKSSALVVIANLLLLLGDEVVPEEGLKPSIDREFLISQIVNEVEDRFRRSDKLKSLPKEAFLSAAKSLHHYVSVDPLNNGCSNFNVTVVALLFRLLGIGLVHGWVLDPEDQQFSSLIGCSYKKVVELSSSTKPTPSSANIINAKEVTDEKSLAKKLLDLPQLTDYGFEELHKSVQEGVLLVLYSNNEFHLMQKHEGDLFILEMFEDTVTKFPDATWKKLAIEEKQTFYVNANFSPTKSQHKKKRKLANKWFAAKLSSIFDDKKSTKKEKEKLKRSLTKELDDIAKESTSESVHYSDDQSKGSPKFDISELASQISSEESSAPPMTAPPKIKDLFLNFLMTFRHESDQDEVPYFKRIVKEMILTDSLKLLVPFSFLQKHSGNLAIQIQDGYPSIHEELVLSVADYLISNGLDKSVSVERASLEIQNLPKPKWNKTYLQFLKDNEMVATYFLYGGIKDSTPTLAGNAMGLGYLNYIFDRFEEGRGWREVEQINKEGEKWSEGWSLGDMEVRNNDKEFVITKEPDAELTQELVVANLLTYVRHVFKPFEGTNLNKYPAFFDPFVVDILKCPEPKKGCLKWKRFVKLMRNALAFKVPLVRSTLLTEFYTVLSLQLILYPSKYATLLCTTTNTKPSTDWRGDVRTVAPFKYVYSYRNNVVGDFIDKWEKSSWHLLSFARHFLHHVLDYLKLMLARELEHFISETIRICVMEYGVDHIFSSAWGHFEASNSTVMPLQTLLQDSSSYTTQVEPAIDKLVIHINPKKLQGHKCPAYVEIDISVQNQITSVLDIIPFLKCTTLQVEEAGEGIVCEDCVEVSLVVKAGAKKIAIQSPYFCKEYSEVHEKLYS